MKLPENDPEMKKFRFDFVVEDNTIIYAKTEQDAIEDFESSYEYDRYDIEELKK